ncbi:MAG: efflux RND transporter periplasmic adaptor subunit [Candidatus Longimicrobiales bacterium M2_2A_002]
MTRHIRVIVLLAATAVGACGGAGVDSGEEARSRVLQPEDVVTVATGEVRTGIAISGPLDPYRTVEVRAQIVGELIAVEREPGTMVTVGDVLARYDAATFRTRVLSARAAVAAGESAVAAARHRLQSTGTLNAAGAVSDQDLRQARSAAEAAAAQLAAAEAQAAQAEEALGQTVVRAPVSGVVAARLASAGEAVHPGRPLFRVVDTDTLELAARVPASEVGSFAVGDAVRFRVDAAVTDTLVGYVDRIEPVADPATRQVTVYTRLPNERGPLVGGLYATGEIVTGTVSGTVVPVDAVVDDPNAGSHVMAVEDGRLVRRPIELLTPPDSRGRVAVAGLSPGALILARPDLGLEEGTPVGVLGAGEPSSGEGSS